MIPSYLLNFKTNLKIIYHQLEIRISFLSLPLGLQTKCPGLVVALAPLLHHNNSIKEHGFLENKATLMLIH